MDVAPYIKAKSNQLNGDDLIGGPITVQIVGVSKGDSDQPVTVKISGGHCPLKPSKTTLRVLCAAWGTDSSVWDGRWMTLYRDDSVKWAGKEVGGIRIKALSHIPRALTLSLAVSRGQKKQHKISVLKAPHQNGAPTANLDALLNESGLTREDVDRWRDSIDKPPLDTLDEDQAAALAGWLAGDTKRLDAIRAMIPTPEEA
ncbi:MAG: hypothetical protein DRQ40_04810 [Gammaproteobacteria bacterium]|nr:MAG: hypothetical protein DRQ40_04810 [Gammaproteobacteria bacterium]